MWRRCLPPITFESACRESPTPLKFRESLVWKIKSSEERKLLGENELNFEDAVTRVEEERKEAERITEEANRIKEEAEQRLQEAEAQIRLAEQEKAKILEDARNQAKGILKETEDTVRISGKS